jgi:hypothetical protein
MAYADPRIEIAMRRVRYRDNKAKEMAWHARWIAAHRDQYRRTHAETMRARHAELMRLVGTKCERCGSPAVCARPRSSGGLLLHYVAGLARRRWPLLIRTLIPLCVACAKALYRERRRAHIRHGTRSGYDQAHCRCHACTAANTRRVAKYRLSKKEITCQPRR